MFSGIICDTFCYHLNMKEKKHYVINFNFLTITLNFLKASLPISFQVLLIGTVCGKRKYFYHQNNQPVH